MNLQNKLDWALNSFSLFGVGYASNIKSAYRRVRVHRDHINYQLHILFDFTETDWENYPWVVLPTWYVVWGHPK